MGGIFNKESKNVFLFIRLNSLEYGELREKLTGTIQNVRNIVIRLSLSDQFLVAFREEVRKNSPFVLPPGMVSVFYYELYLISE